LSTPSAPPLVAHVFNSCSFIVVVLLGLMDRLAIAISNRLLLFDPVVVDLKFMLVAFHCCTESAHCKRYSTFLKIVKNQKLTRQSSVCVLLNTLQSQQNFSFGDSHAREEKKRQLTPAASVNSQPGRLKHFLGIVQL